MASDETLAPCECEEHPCRSVPGQTERYRVNLGPFEQGVVKLCPWCFVNGCMWMKEMRWRMARELARSNFEVEDKHVAG